MKILILADIHGSFEMLNKVIDHAEKDNPDLVVCPGNLTDMFNNQSDISQLDVGDMIVQKLLSIRKRVFCVPGNHDPYELIEILDDYKVNLHSKNMKLKNINFIGFGGAKTPFNTNFEPSEEETKHGLNSLNHDQPMILITHNPPKDTKLDKIKSGDHVGSLAVREFILAKKPILNITAHIHEAVGKDMLGPTILFNPGPVFEGNYGIVKIENNKVLCEFKKVKI